MLCRQVQVDSERLLLMNGGTILHSPPQRLVKSPGVHVIARRFVLKDIIPEKEIGNVIFDHDVASLFDDEQVYFQGHLAQIVFPLIGQVFLVFPQFQFHGGAECGMPLYIVLYFQ